MVGGQLLSFATCFSSAGIVYLPFLPPADEITLMVVEETHIFQYLLEEKKWTIHKDFFSEKNFNLLKYQFVKKVHVPEFQLHMQHEQKAQCSKTSKT